MANKMVSIYKLTTYDSDRPRYVVVENGNDFPSILDTGKIITRLAKHFGQDAEKFASPIRSVELVDPLAVMLS